MRNKEAIAESSDFSTLIQGIAADGQKLLAQQFELLRTELRDEVRQTAGAAGTMAAGAGMAALGGVLSAQMLVHMLHKSTKLPLWTCYGAVGAALALAGAKLMSAGGHKLPALGLPPTTTKTLQENLAWIKDQARGGP